MSRPPTLISRSPKLPTLFGRATAVLGEHPTLDRAIHRLRELGETLDDESAPPIAERCRLMDELLVRMRAHFAAEEAEYFATLVAACPPLKNRVAALSREHEEFMSSAHWLRAAFERDARDSEFHANLSSFIDRFVSHEHEETVLLQEFLQGQNS